MQSYSKLKEVTNIGSAINEKKRTIKGNDEPKSEELKIFKLFIIINWREAEDFIAKFARKCEEKLSRFSIIILRKLPVLKGSRPEKLILPGINFLSFRNKIHGFFDVGDKTRRLAVN